MLLGRIGVVGVGDRSKEDRGGRRKCEGDEWLI
jgi:hypothetical protein